MTMIVLLLPLADVPALRVQFQPIKLPLVELIHCCLRWQNSVEIVALPFHPALIEVLAVRHVDEPSIQEDSDTFHCGIFGHACLGCDGVVAGMAGVRPAIFNQQQIGVDHERRGREVQQKDFVRQGEKLFAVSILESGSVLIGDEPFTNQTDRYFFTVTIVMRAPFAILSGDRFVPPWES